LHPVNHVLSCGVSLLETAKKEDSHHPISDHQLTQPCN
jgi:hypothetical protein